MATGELAQLCKELRITLIPEIDMPGHSAAFTRAMGFDMQSTEGKRVVKDLLTELAEHLDVPYIHLGTDETTFSDKLFVPEMVEHVHSLGILAGRSRTKKWISSTYGARRDKVATAYRLSIVATTISITMISLLTYRCFTAAEYWG